MSGIMLDVGHRMVNKGDFVSALYSSKEQVFKK